MDLPELDPEETRQACGCILHPETWTTLREAAREAGKGASDALAHPVLGTSEFVGRGQVALVYDLPAMLEALAAEGLTLTPVVDLE